VEKKDNSNVSSYCLASELSFLAKIDFQSGDGSIQNLFQASNEILFGKTALYWYGEIS
jgi:hypothetical protein